MIPQTDSDSPAKRGRPAGTTETPQSLIEKELIAHLKLYKKLREMVERRIEDVSIDADTLTKYMELLRKGIVEMAKPIIPNARPVDAKPIESEENAEMILQRLIDGDSRR